MRGAGQTSERDATATTSGRTDDASSDVVLRALVAEHSAAAFRLARSIVKDAALSDDITQETFIKVWKHLDEFRATAQYSQLLNVVVERRRND